MNTTNDRIIIGIDPGTNVMGYGVLRIVGNTPELMTLGVIQLNKFESHYLRLRRIFERVLGLIEQYLPDEMAIEAPFFGKNVQSMLKLGRAQGVAMAGAPSPPSPPLSRHSHYRIRPIKNQNVDYRKRKCIERTSRRHVTAHSAYPR